MQNMLNLRVTHGVPLCLSGITNRPLALSKEMADHERRRKAMRKQRLVHANQEKGTQTNNDDFVVEIKGDGDDDQEDMNQILHQLSSTYLTGLSAKAA